ncbi:hypothetical protein [Cellulomonas denverensis]|uniref:hypothetical protein n=1 Tax=Cellulomonas denverensis TaxID=264297 RepID=UPI0035EFDED4
MNAAPRGYHEDPAIMFLHRSIGGYITMFSEMTASMRQQIGAYLAPVDVEFPISDRLLDVLFASMTADRRCVLLALDRGWQTRCR